MVNWVEAQKPLLHGLMKFTGLRQTSIEIEPGTVMSFWLPKEKLDDNKNDNNEKPVVVLVHGFAAEGIVTWQFQVNSLMKKYAVYVPDLIFFGGSMSKSDQRSPRFQAECLGIALEQLGVEKCTVVGFSYGGMVAFKLAEMKPEMVESLVVSGSVIAMTDSISETGLERLGFSSSAELLLPESVKGLKALLKVAAYKKLWFPDCLYRDYLKVMFKNRKERAELLEGLVVSNKDAVVPALPQRILLLWGENDNIFNIHLANKMKEQLGEKATVQGIEKAGHLVHLERPFAYNQCLKEYLALIYPETIQN
ncbi:LOW QUALITY PROTEIN: epoxide hydrolase 4-like [Dioscorea cayenensis subsp. rotundata]|uniref:LOW QUALITY PROTEIN: epoxide hydrolase 4-like n=1 Tax=Dioscorea cayennensis subsp. rotundata TaxID=55577 RepID=A0AB40B505_DIOCR|nr:LOW QUALITY PROTEIN: epoxide hydrolase 4-like [Dioscorea cayenensis subsp. rotundata]